MDRCEKQKDITAKVARILMNLKFSQHNYLIMNKLFQIFILLIIIALTTWAVWKPARAFLGFNSNEIKVSADGPLNIGKIVIEKGNFSINRASDRELFTSKNEVIFNGQPTNPAGMAMVKMIFW